jgi:MFS family permease
MATSSASTASTAATANQATPLVMRIIGFCALAHLINDLIQSVLPAIYPMLKANYNLSFAQIGMITLTFQITASLLQPWVGFFTDRRPTPNLLPLGTLCTLVGIVMLAFVGSFPMILLASALVGIGSSTFHPKPRVSRGWPRAGASAWPSRPSRSAATPVPHWARCWRRPSSFRSARPTWPGSAWRGCSSSASP